MTEHQIIFSSDGKLIPIKINNYKPISLKEVSGNSMVFSEDGIKPLKEYNSQLICGDNLERMKTIEDETIDLIYCDPPFLSQHDYEIINEDSSEVRKYEDTIKEVKIDDDHNVENKGPISIYLNEMITRFKEMYRILKNTGSFYFHCDYRVSHYVKVILDKEIFGYNNFRNEIVWSFSGRENPNQTMFARKHNVILYYIKSNNFTFNPQFKPYRKEYVKQFFTHDDIDGKGLYQLQSNGKGGQYKQYLNKSNGHPINDVWIDIMPLNNRGRQHEQLGYPNQKPEALLERIICASSNEGDVILDPFCGSGTTIAVAKRLGRHFIGIDSKPTAIRLTAQRINFPISKINGIYSTPYELKSLPWQELQQWVCNKFNASNILHPNGKNYGFDGIIKSNFNTNFIGCPIQVKSSDNVGRDVVISFYGSMDNANKKVGFLVAFSFGAGAKEQVNQYKLENKADIKLVTIDELCKTNYYESN